MQQIQQIERVLGKEYGQAPKEVKNTWLNRYVNCIKQTDNQVVGVLGGLLIASINPGDAFYTGEDHTIWTPKEITPFSEFAIFHELGHGYTRQRNPRYREIDDLLAQEGTKGWTGGKFSRDTVGEAFLHRCVDEGIADYLAIQAQKSAVQNGKRMPEDVFCYEREWMLVHFKDAEYGERFTESTSLDYGRAAKLEEMGKRVIESFLSVNEAKGMERFKRSRRAVTGFYQHAYILGHYLVRATVNDLQEGLGEGIDQLIMSPPKSIKEIQDIALSAF